MPRNRYTRFVRRLERQQLIRQEKELIVLVRALRHGITVEVELPLLPGPKDRRTARLDQKRQHQPERPDKTRTGQHSHQHRRERAIAHRASSLSAIPVVTIAQKGA